MSFEYDVMTEEEAQKAREFPTLPDGLYDFAVTEHKLTYSKNGNAMIALKLRIIHDGQEFNVFDNLIGTKNMAWKTKHFCDTTGLEKEYIAKQFNERLCANKRGTCAIGFVGATPKNDGSGQMWKAKNEVVDYISADKLGAAQARVDANPFAPAASKLPPAPPEAEPFFNDDVPF
jgi:hypothetical protein